MSLLLVLEWYGELNLMFLGGLVNPLPVLVQRVCYKFWISIMSIELVLSGVVSVCVLPVLRWHVAHSFSVSGRAHY